MWTAAVDLKTMVFSPAVPHAPGGLSVTQANGIVTLRALEPAGRDGAREFGPVTGWSSAEPNRGRSGR